MVNTVYPAIKLLEMREKGYDLDKYLIVGQGSYTFYKLTGQRIVSESIASGSGLLNIHKKVFDKDILKFIGIDENQLCRISTYTDVQPLTGEGARLLGLQSGIPVIPTYPDGALTQVGAGALGENVMTFSVGTSGAIRMSVKNPGSS